MGRQLVDQLGKHFFCEGAFYQLEIVQHDHQRRTDLMKRLQQRFRHRIGRQGNIGNQLVIGKGIECRHCPAQRLKPVTEKHHRAAVAG